MDPSFKVLNLDFMIFPHAVVELFTLFYLSNGDRLDTLRSITGPPSQWISTRSIKDCRVKSPCAGLIVCLYLCRRCCKVNDDFESA